MKALRTTTAVAIALVGLGLIASQASAQTPDPVRAEAAYQQAVAAEAQAARTGSQTAALEAAKFHVESANARPINDPRAIASLRTAAMYLSYSKPARAAELLATAAERALAMGDVLAAANAYLDAAAALTEPQANRVSQDQFEKVERWIIQATLLAESPLLSVDERELILRRVSPVDFGNYAG